MGNPGSKDTDHDDANNQSTGSSSGKAGSKESNSGKTGGKEGNSNSKDSNNHSNGKPGDINVPESPNNNNSGGGKSGTVSGTPKSPRLPLQLKRLPSSSLRQVSAALAVLAENGLTAQVNVEELLDLVSKTVEVSEGMTSEYMDMNSWARTRSSWVGSVGKLEEKQQHCKIASATPEQWQTAIDEAAAAKEKGQEAAEPGKWKNRTEEGAKKWRMPEKILESLGNCEWHTRLKQEEDDCDDEGNVRKPGHAGFFEAWWAAQLAADDELRKCADPNFKPKTVGIGHSVIFSFSQPTGTPPQPKRNLAETGVLPAKVPVGKSGHANYVTLHVGAEGCGIGGRLWSRLLDEHKIGKDGKQQEGAYGIVGPHFEESATGRMVPRAVFVSDGDGVQHGSELGCFNPEDLVKVEDYTATSFKDFESMDENENAKKLYDVTVERLRQDFEKMDRGKNLIITHSWTGACGSGLTAALLRHASNQYSKATKFCVTVVPSVACDFSEQLHGLVNLTGTFNEIMEHSDARIWVDTEGLQALCDRRGDAEASDTDRWDLVGRMVAGLTAPGRIGVCQADNEGCRKVRLEELMTNLTPYPRISTYLAGYAPLRGKGKTDFSTEKPADMVLAALRKGLMSAGKLLDDSKYIGTSILYRSSIPTPEPIFSAKALFKQDSSVKYVDWCPTGILGGFHSDPGFGNDGEVVCLFNSTGISKYIQAWSTALEEKVDDYTPIVEEWGLEEGRISNSDMASFIQDYEEVGAETAEGGGEEGEEEE